MKIMLYTEVCHTEIFLENLRHNSFLNPQISFQFSHFPLPIFVDCSLYMFNTLRCSACCRPSRMWITFNRFLTIFEAFVPHFYLCCTNCINPKSYLNHLNNFLGGMFKLNAKSDADSLFYSVILKVLTTQYTCSLNSLYCSH